MHFLKLFFFFPGIVAAQTIVSGTVTENNGRPISGANVYLEGTYDGATTNEKGEFSFETAETGTQTLTVSFLSFETFVLKTAVSEMKNLNINLREDVNSLDAVVISAGTFEAGDNSKVSVLKPLDVVTTASALGDFVGALQTLPGTTTVAEDGRLFVRGGEAGESQIFIDGLRVFTPYSPTANNVPTRGRYSPFLFDGITFSTGGYSAEFGQALSSVLLLNTIDEPAQEKTDIALMTVGLGLGNTQIWKKSSLSVNASYINLAPYTAVFPDRNEWEKPFETFAGEAVFRQKTASGLLKAYAAFDSSEFDLTQEDINRPEGTHFALGNRNFYSNLSYSEALGNGWAIFGGGSYTLNRTKMGIDSLAIKDVENSAHLKFKLKKRFNNRLKLSFGAEQFFTSFKEDVSGSGFFETYAFENPISAAFAESDLIFSRKFAMKLGIRAEHAALFSETVFSPRLSVAYKTGKNSQLSLAYGDFYQQPDSEILKFENDLGVRKTQHYILNYQYSEDNRLFRAEAYLKEYENLVLYGEEFPTPESEFSNGGDGHARGIDIFWRDNKTFEHMDYWVSYSFLDSERKHKNFPVAATPSFVNKHNLSVVAKYWVDAWKTQFGFTYQFGSGRPYTDKNRPGFLQETTPSYNNVSVNCAYLLSQQKILYFSINNVFGFQNINGYQYANSPDSAGNFARRELRPAADQFFFVGFFWTLSSDGSENQLDNL